MESAFSQPMADGSYRVSSGFGMRNGAMHRGVDMAAPVGTPIYAAAAGTVATVGAASGFGQWIVLDHIIGSKKYSTVYGHMFPNGVHVNTGAVVKKGQHIADVGNNGVSTGAHLHFEVWDGGRLTGGTAVNPETLTLGSNAGGAQASSAMNLTDDGPSVTGSIGAVWDFITFIIDPRNWWRLFLFLCGTVLVLYVLYTTMVNGGK